MSERGTRPKTGQPWPRNQEKRRSEAERLGKDIAGLARKGQETTSMQMRDVYLSRLEALGERVARLMVEARIGAPAIDEEDEE